MARGLPMDLGRAGTVTAVLGPTNTGKTHLAVQRMLGHRTGMIGLPLRLLAREVYDRIVEAKGPDQVALVTGEEKIVPTDTRYWVCTVESMPLDRPVAFLAVDEVQLAGSRARGHVFTDRLLHARGVAETWFLGSDTIGPLLQQLVPTGRIRSQPRLSRLSYAGPRKVTALPPRSAVVAFSVAEVYELAERLRSRHGGAAVVMGALSPRTRNAQVELFQNGDVAHLVATDAIGMGLNMDVHHVALAGARKFDGRGMRELAADELAQIAGRAGRWRRDGTFGETAGLDPLPSEVVEAIESHQFQPLQRLYWRNRDLCFDDVASLVRSLDLPAPRRFLTSTRDADDARVLARLAVEEEVLSRATDPERVALLWDACGVPDFGNVLPEHHADLVRQIYVHLVDGDGTLPEAWVARQVARLDRVDGDIGTLMARIAGIRIWTYVANRPTWVEDAAGWRERTRAIEDAISDALHTRLTARFVDHRARAIVRAEHPLAPTPELRPDGEVTAGGERLGYLRGLSFEATPLASASTPALRAVRRLVTPMVAARLAALVASPDGAFSLDADGAVCWDGARVAWLLRGASWTRPKLRVLRQDWLDGDARGALAARLEAWLRSWLQHLTQGLAAGDAGDPVVRGLLFALERGGGVASVQEVGDLLAGLDGRGRASVKARGVVIGRDFVLHPKVVERVAERAALWNVHHGTRLEVPDDGGRAPFQAAWEGAACRALGFARVGAWLVRVDTLEAALASTDAAREREVPREVLERLRRAAPPPTQRPRPRRRRR